MSDERGTPVANRTTSGEPEYTGQLRAEASEARLLVDGRVHEGAMESMALPSRYRLVMALSSGS